MHHLERLLIVDLPDRLDALLSLSRGRHVRLMLLRDEQGRLATIRRRDHRLLDDLLAGPA